MIQVFSQLKRFFFNTFACILYIILLSGVYMWGNNVLSFFHNEGLPGLLNLHYHQLALFLFWTISALFLTIHVAITLLHNFTFDAFGGRFFKSRRLFKKFLIENDSRVTKIKLSKLPFMTFGSQANPFFRALTYAGAVLAYSRYRKIKFMLFNDIEKSKQAYLETTKAINIQQKNPVVHDIMFDPRFQEKVTFLHRLLSKWMVIVGIAWTACLFCWLIISVI